MSIPSAKHPRIPKSNDKENNHYNSNNFNDLYKTSKEGLKTGVQIRNKLKAKNLFKPINPPGKKQPIRKNSHIVQKSQTKVLQQRFQPQKNLSKDDCNLSSSSSVRSIKSVTFTIDHSIDSDISMSRSNSSTGIRKKSILKNKLLKEKESAANEVNHEVSQKQSLASSHCSHIKSSDQAVESLSSNSILMQKYQRLLKQLKANRQKYTDSIYPPCESSIFLKSSYTKDFLQKLNNEGYKIKWIRLNELYPLKKQCLWHPQLKSIITKGFINSSNKQHNYMPTVLNAINKSYLMEKFFENQTLCPEGIYFVKIHQTQTNQWRYIIVDDFVPVVVSNKIEDFGKVIKPAFLDVTTQGNVVELWPFFVQKAFAKYYSTYDSLIKGNTLDFLEQITGNYFSTLQLNFIQKGSNIEKEGQEKILKIMKNPYNIILAQTIDGMIYPVKGCNSTDYQILDIQSNFKEQRIQNQHFMNYFTQIHVIEAKKYSNQLTCLIKQQHILQNSQDLNDQKKPFILRSFTLRESTLCTLALTQKQERFHRSSKGHKIKQNYIYSWIRMILVMKEPTGYRWIAGIYQNNKILKIQTQLDIGEYFVIILPQWTTRPYDLKLSLFSNSTTVIQRKSYESHARIIEQSCMDLAQRFGKLTQINPNICSYNYIDYKVGFIIENINNEKTSGQVKILRTIDGLEAFNITPVNSEFQHKSKLQIRISSLQSFTVVLKVSGGVQKSFLQQFDFGI